MRCKNMPQVNYALDLGWLRLGGVSADRYVVKVGDFQLFQVAQKEGTFVEIIGLRKGAVWDNPERSVFLTNAALCSHRSYGYGRCGELKVQVSHCEFFDCEM